MTFQHNDARQLWADVVLKALRDAAYTGQESLDIRAREEAKDWLKGDSADFYDVCTMAGIDGGVVRDRFKAGLIDFSVFTNASIAGGKRGNC